jgi:hypothetical protein
MKSGTNRGYPPERRHSQNGKKTPNNKKQDEGNKTLANGYVKA